METAIRLPKKRKVPAVKNACIHCRLAKRACDFQRPCARCKQKQLFCTILPPNQIHIPSNSTSQPTPTDPSSSTSLSPQQASGSFPIFTFHVDSKGPTHTTHTTLNANKSLPPQQQQQQQQPPYYYPPSSTLYTLPTGDTIPLDTSPDLPVVIEEQPNEQQEQQLDQQNSQQQNQQNQQNEQQAQHDQQPVQQVVTIKKCGGACGCACERMMMKQSLEMANASSSIPSTNQYDLEWLSSSSTDLSFIPDSPIHEPLGAGTSDEKTTNLLEKQNQLLEKLITMNISKEQAQNGSKSLDPNTRSKFSPYSLWEISTQRLIACNNSFQHMVGYNMEDLTTKFYIYQLVPDRYINDQKRLWALMSTLKNKVEMKLCLKAKDGREICVCTSMMLMPDKLHVMMEHTPMEFCDDKWSIGEFTHFPTYRLTPQQCKHTAQNIYEIWKVFNDTM